MKSAGREREGHCYKAQSVGQTETETKVKLVTDLDVEGEGVGGRM